MHVHEQCEYLLAAMDRVSTECAAMRAERRLPRPSFWGDVQSVVLAAGNVSKLMWGQGGSRADKRAHLRESIGISDNSPLRLTRMRNHFEHVDERLETWFKESSQHIYADGHVFLTPRPPQGMVEADPPMDRVNTFREYDAASGTLWFWGDQLNLREIESEVRRIIPTIREKAARPFWED
jgi:hypothetical protein